MNEFLQRLGKLSLPQKIAAMVGVMALVAAAFYYLFYADLSNQSAALDGQVTQLEEEKTGYEEKKQRYMAFRAEVKKLLQEKRELVKVLPTRAEIPSFLQSLHSQAELAGLNILTFDKQGEILRDFYAEIPVRMVISGTYHQVNKFFFSVGQLKRIVNIQDVLLSQPKKTGQGMRLTAKFVSSTFRFIEERPAAPAGGAPAGGGHG